MQSIPFGIAADGLHLFVKFSAGASGRHKVSVPHHDVFCRRQVVDVAQLANKRREAVKLLWRGACNLEITAHMDADSISVSTVSMSTNSPSRSASLDCAILANNIMVADASPALSFMRVMNLCRRQVIICRVACMMHHNHIGLLALVQAVKIKMCFFHD